MKIHGMCLVKNEADILSSSLRQSATWCDHIYVFDTGSKDGSWQVINELAGELPQIIPFRAERRNFDDALRSEIFKAFKESASAGDWWCRLDADEIYVDPPRAFLSAVPALHHVVWAISINHYFTKSDLERANYSPVSAETLPRYYSANWSEPRFFRHRAGLIWEGNAWPKHLGVVTPKRIRLNHYQYRSPAQIQLRLDTRREAAASGWAHFGHSENENWEEKITPEGSLEFDALDGGYVIDESKLPIHVEPSGQRLLKLLLHGMGIWP